MAKRLPLLTEQEVKLMTLLWERGPATLSQIVPERDRSVMVPVIQTLQTKGYLSVAGQDADAIYTPTISHNAAYKSLFQQLADLSAAGSMHMLVSQFLGGRKPTTRQLADIDKLLDEDPG